MRGLRVHSCGPMTSLQDQGRAGLLGYGISRGGAMDPLALAEGAALLDQSPDLAAIELAGLGGTFEALSDLRIAVTGAEMSAQIDGVAVRWNGSHALPKGAVLAIGAAKSGNYAYLHVGGGVEAPCVLGARSTHFVAELGEAITAGTVLSLGPDQGGNGTVQGLDVAPRFQGGRIRILPSMQTDLFAPEVLERFENTVFKRDARANRMGMQILSDGAPFATSGQLNILSEIIVPGDIQMTGSGTPFVLLNECQTTGGYPRIATVIPSDMARVAQAGQGVALTFEFVDSEEALSALKQDVAHLAALPAQVHPLIRDPRDMPDLLSFSLIGGVISATDPPE